MESLRWQYAENPDGQAIGFNALDDRGDLAAHFVTVPMRARLLGEEVRGLLSLNTATHPAHAGKGLFTTLANETYAHAKSLGYRFVIGVANQNSTPGFLRKLGFSLVGPLKAMVGVGNGFLAWFEHSTPDIQFSRVWSTPSLAWRLRNPAGCYRIARNNDICLAFSRTETPMVKAILGCFPAKDCPKGGPNSKTGKRVFNLCLTARAPRGACPPLYLNIPARFRPSPLNLIYRDLQNPSQRLDIDRVDFFAMDFDAY